MLAPTCAHTCIVVYMALYTIVWRIFLYTTTRTHTHMYSVLAHTSYTCGKQYTCLMMVQTLSLTNIVICTCTITCILFNSADCISICVPSLHNTHMHEFYVDACAVLTCKGQSQLRFLPSFSFPWFSSTIHMVISTS